ncbi:glycosyl transferase [Microlunatus endophyticus]|uniref:Glycosyl transferase n=1 Tax=Microlunatus endophyticus TaxID=1716077 RepID=A0A917SJJ9_9ACTN|nr:sugar transferase [Microlunatus endophyticus]GGL83330.1 glycosyl transferase [Microlunatus endophyticus]
MTQNHTSGWQRILAGAGLLITSPVLAGAAAGIKLSDGGAVFYRATRAGVARVPFTMYKLRTMRHGADQAGSITAADDPRVFPFGRWLRQLKVDELPQLLNVVRGEMALVGPRPEAVDIVREYYLPWMDETLTVPPGITGPGSLHFIAQDRQLPRDPAQAREVYAREILPIKLAHELVYIRSRSLGYEIQLIVRTLLRMFSADGLFESAAELEGREARAILGGIGSQTS